MRIIIQVVQNYLTQDKASIVLSVEEQKGQKYYFNIPDATQRFQKEHGMALAKGSRIFLTSLSPEHINGLLGLLCTLSAQDRGEDTCVFGAGVSEFLESTRYLLQLNLNLVSSYDFKDKTKLLGFSTSKDLVKWFVENKDYSAHMQYNFNSFIKSNNIKPNDASRFIDAANNTYKDEFLSIQPIIIASDKVIARDGAVHSSQIKVSYIITTKPIPGKVIKDKLAEYKVPAKLTGQLLKNGKVTLDDGTVVTAESVKEEDVQPQVILLVDIDSINEVKQLLLSPPIKKLIESKTEIGCVVSLADAHTVNSDFYKIELLSQLNVVQHLIVNGQNQQAIESSELEILNKSYSNRIQLTTNLNNCSKSHFPDLSIHSILNRFNEKHISISEAYPSNTYVGCPLKECVVYPFKSRGYYVNKSVQQRLASKQQEQEEKVEKAIDKLSISETEAEESKASVLEEPIKSKEASFDKDKLKESFKNNLVFLGTGSMLPTPLRTVSGILIERENKNNILLDCGEGTYSQIICQFGEERGSQIVRNTRLIFISHVHLDHCMGLFYFLQKRDLLIQQEQLHLTEEEITDKYLLSRDLFIIIPSNVAPLVRSFNKHCLQLPAYNKFVFANDLSELDPAGKSEVFISKESVTDDSKKWVDFSDFEVKVNEGDKFDHYEHPKINEIVNQYFSQNQSNLLEFQSRLVDYLQINKLQLCQVIHCSLSYGIAIDLIVSPHDESSATSPSKELFKISYSGDTRPCNLFEQIANKSNIFIHECTFSDDLINNAIDNNHSTLSEAINSCKASHSNKLVLTHFSQRYSLIDVDQYKGDKEFLQNHTVVAFDHFIAGFEEYHIDGHLSKITQEAQKTQKEEAS